MKNYMLQSKETPVARFSGINHYAALRDCFDVETATNNDGITHQHFFIKHGNDYGVLVLEDNEIYSFLHMLEEYVCHLKKKGGCNE